MAVLPTTTTPTEADLEFDRQVDALAQTGLPAELDVKDECFRAMLEPLRDLLPRPAVGGDGIPFVVVVPDAPAEPLLAAVHTPDGVGGTPLGREELERFRALPELDVPVAPYLLLGVDPGAGTCGVAPAEAVRRITGAGRTPLTIAEGLALLVSDCGLLRAGSCFALAGSSAGGVDVPALWRGPDGPMLRRWAPSSAHPRLGSASCAGRRAA
jgi:Family of unknown function (DUF5701)